MFECLRRKFNTYRKHVQSTNGLRKAPNMTYGRDIHTQTGSQEPSMRHKIRTYDTLAFTTHHKCMHEQQEHASGPHDMGFG